MDKTHKYTTKVIWKGNKGTGTSSYNSYERSYVINISGKCGIEGSSDPAFLGDKTKHNPEELLVSSLSSCHMLWYLHLCAVNNIRVVDYEDDAIGTMLESKDTGGHFTEVILNPRVTISNDSSYNIAVALHEEANRMCFIANSVNFKVFHKPTIIISNK